MDMVNGMPDNGVILSNDQRLLLSLCRDYKLAGFMNALEEQFNAPSLYLESSFEARLLQCFDEQQKQNKSAKFERLYSRSRVQWRHFLREIVPEPERGLNKEILLTLSECNYISKGLNVILCGPAGSGKTALAKAIANEAMMHGQSALFYRLSELSREIENKDSAAFGRFLTQLSRVDLLVIDDYGLTKLPDPLVAGLMEIITIRYGRGTNVITTQLRRGAFQQVMEKSPIRDALLDRMFRPNDLEITLKGESWRGQTKELK